ncbi:hypothetical protein [Streptomyces sp. CO7]
MAATLQQCWVGDAGRAAREKFVKHAGDYEAASLSLRALARVYDDLAEDIAAAQRELNSVLDYAHRHGLRVDESGRVGFAQPVLLAPDSPEYQQVTDTRDLVMEALAKANKADLEAAKDLRTIEGLTLIGDPAMARESLSGDSPLAIALRLSGGLDGVHPINVPPNILDAVKLASAETGISRKLLMAILWQEQQWYQNHNPSLRGPLAAFGRFFN